MRNKCVTKLRDKQRKKSDSYNMMYQLEYSYRPTGIKHCVLSKIPSSYYRLPQCLKRVGNSYFFREILQQQKRHLPLRRHSIITSDLSIVKATRITLFPRHLIQEESVGSYYIHINHSIAHSKIQGTVMCLAHNGETRTGILQVKEQGKYENRALRLGSSCTEMQ